MYAMEEEGGQSEEDGTRRKGHTVVQEKKRVMDETLF